MNDRIHPDSLQTRLLSRRTLVMSLAALAGGYLVGCGGDEDDAPAQSQPSSEPTAEPTGDPSVAPTEATEEPATTPPPAVSVFEATPTWTRLAGVGPSARRDHSLVATADGGSVILFGGREQDGPLEDTWLYDVAADIWTQVQGGPSARFGHNAVYDSEGSRIILFGGQAGSNFYNDTWSFDGQTWQQLTLADPPSPRYGAGAAFAPGGVYVSHGFTDSGRFDDTWRMPLEGDAWGDESPAAGPRPIERCLLRTVFDNESKRVLLFGGQTDSDPFLGDLWALDPAADTWTEIAQNAAPSARNLYSLVHADQPAALLFGGRAEEGALNDLWVLDFLSDSWLQVAADGEAPSGRSGHDAAWLTGQNSMLVFGGRDAGQTLLNETWRLDFA
ncbi:MAG TPA: kelch repeat-containing protein [Dehalococcoidia bacterium]|nr:kelch repeat-containing protein [Dehalococcoidia bacterium]